MGFTHIFILNSHFIAQIWSVAQSMDYIMPPYILSETEKVLIGVVSDESALQKLNPGSALLQGYLMKQGGSKLLKSWKKRWLSLEGDNCLYYYKTKTVILPLLDLHG